jgi:hypothetical protein
MLMPRTENPGFAEKAGVNALFILPSRFSGKNRDFSGQVELQHGPDQSSFQEKPDFDLPDP